MEILNVLDPTPRVAETCRCLAEVHAEVMPFDEVEKPCMKTLEIHREHNTLSSLGEAYACQCMALLCKSKGDSMSSLENLVFASTTILVSGRDNDVAVVDVSTGNMDSSLRRFDEAGFSYLALTFLKSKMVDNHPTVASVIVCLSALYYKRVKLRESKSDCENALCIYAELAPGTAAVIASWLTEISAIHEALNKSEEALELLHEAVKLLRNSPGQCRTITGKEAEMWTGMFYMVGSYGEARTYFESALTMLQASGDGKFSFFGIELNRMGLASLQLYEIAEAAEVSEESKGILEQKCPFCHLDTLTVYTNLIAT